MAKVFSRVRSWFLEASPSGGGSGESSSVSASSSSQWACVRVMHSIARCCPDLLFAHAGLTLPLVFINTQVYSFLISLHSFVQHLTGANFSASLCLSLHSGNALQGAWITHLLYIFFVHQGIYRNLPKQ